MVKSWSAGAPSQQANSDVELSPEPSAGVTAALPSRHQGARPRSGRDLRPAQARVPPPQPRRHLLFLPIALAFLWGAAAHAANLPMTGTSRPELRGFDGVISNFMARYAIPGGAVGVVKDGKLVLARGYGYADTNTLELVYPDSRFRLASLSKSITAAAILKLVEQGKFSLEDKAFGLLNYPRPSYPGAANDPRLDTITVRQLLNHAGGWNRGTAAAPDGTTYFDPTISWTARAAADMQAPSPATPEILVQWMLGKPLQFDPGTQYQYSNFGYTVLGRIVERASGLSYEEYGRNLLASAGITRMRIGGSRWVEKAPGEVTYYDYPDASLMSSVFPEDPGPVPSPYAYSMRAMDAHGGWIASPIDLLRFITAVDGRATPPDLLSNASLSNLTARPSPPWGKTDVSFYGMGWMVRTDTDTWWHSGALPGVGTYMVRAGNGFTWALLFNSRAWRSDTRFYNDLDALGWNAIAAVTNWPTGDLFGATLSYDAWRARRFTAAALAEPMVSGDAADPDGDGLVNLAEYALGLNPQGPDRSGRPELGRVTVAGQPYLALTFRRLPLEHEVTWRVEASDDLAHWQPAAPTVATPVANADGTLTVTHRDDSPIGAKPHHFLRLSVARKAP